MIKGNVCRFKGRDSLVYLFLWVCCSKKKKKKNLRRTALCACGFLLFYLYGCGLCREPWREPQASVTSHRMFAGKLLYMFQKLTVTCHFLDISVPNIRLRDFDHEGEQTLPAVQKAANLLWCLCCFDVPRVIFFFPLVFSSLPWSQWEKQKKKRVFWRYTCWWNTPNEDCTPI